MKEIPNGTTYDFETLTNLIAEEPDGITISFNDKTEIRRFRNWLQYKRYRLEEELRPLFNAEEGLPRTGWERVETRIMSDNTIWLGRQTLKDFGITAIYGGKPDDESKI